MPVHLTPWSQCWIEAAGLVCHRRAHRSTAAWSIPSTDHDLWRLDAGPVRHFDGNADAGCAAMMDGSVRCWSSGEASRGVEGLQGIQRVAYRSRAHQTHACGIDRSGAVWCWQGREDPPGAPPSMDLPKELVSKASHVALLGESGCATGDDELLCWDDLSGVSRGYEFTPAAIQVAMSLRGPCALLRDGTVSCVDEEASGKVAVVQGVRDAVAITAADQHLCALRRDGSVWCWGENFAGQRGNERAAEYFQATPVTDLQDAVAVFASGLQSCARRANGEVVCWGFDRLYRDRVGAVRPQRPSRVYPEPEPSEAPADRRCGATGPRDLELSSLRDRIRSTFEQGTEAELLVLFEQLALDPLADSETLPPGTFLIPNLEQLDIDVVPIVSDGDVVVQLLIVNSDGGWHDFRAQAYRPLGGGQYCPLLSPSVSEGELAGEWSCHRETRSERPWSWSFASVLEPNRNVIVMHDYADTYDGDWECPTGDIRRTQSFHTVEAGKLSPPLLTLGSRTSWKRGDERIAAEWSETDSSFELEGDYPKRIVVTERRTTCRGADRPGCPTPRRRESVTVFGFDGNGYSPISKGRR